MALMTPKEVMSITTLIDTAKSDEELIYARKQLVSYSLNHDTVLLAKDFNQKLEASKTKSNQVEPLDVRHIRVLIALQASAQAVIDYNRLQSAKITSPFSKDPTFDWYTHFEKLLDLIARTSSNDVKKAYKQYFIDHTVTPLRALFRNEPKLEVDYIEQRFASKVAKPLMQTGFSNSVTSV